MQIEQEAMLSPQDTVFLDRALPDALAYYYFLNLPPNERIKTAVKIYRYKKIFILNLLPLVQDYARREDDEAQKKIHSLIIKVYNDLNFPIIYVPVLPPNERVEFIMKNL